MIKKLRKLEFKSLKQNIHLIEKFVDEICDDFNIFNSYFGNIIIALTEAVTNAIIHGNKNNPLKKVIVTFKSKSTGLSFSVEDEGDGFNFNNIPDPTEVTDIKIEDTQKGLFLIKSLADEVHFYESGRIVEIVFKVSSINNDITLERINQLNQYSSVKKEKSIEK